MSGEDVGVDEEPHPNAQRTDSPSEQGAAPVAAAQASPKPPILSRPVEPGRPWRLGAVVCVAAAVCSFALVFAVTGQPSQAASSAAAAGPTSTSSAAGAGGASGPTFSRLPKQCDLISAATAAKYLPGAICDPIAYQTSGSRNATWNSPISLTGSVYYAAHINVLLSQPSLSQPLYDKMKSEIATLMSWVTVQDSRPVTGLGNEAYIVFGTRSESSEAYLLVVDGNTEIDIQYEVSSIGRQVQAGSESRSEAAVLAMSHDVIRNLS